jgi:site-specific recombinase XerD
LVDEKLPKHISLPKRAQKLMPVLTTEQIRRLTLACGDNLRDRAIRAVLLDTGIRASELCGLTLDRVIVTQEDAYLIVQSKGRKTRELGLGRQSRSLLHRYLTRARHTRQTNSQAVFLRRGGDALRPEGLDRILYRLRDKAGLDGVRVAAHVFRHTHTHTHAYTYISQGGDLMRLSRLLGPYLSLDYPGPSHSVHGEPGATWGIGPGQSLLGGESASGRQSPDLPSRRAGGFVYAL